MKTFNSFMQEISALVESKDGVVVSTHSDPSRRYESKVIQLGKKQYLVTKTGNDEPMYYAPASTGFNKKPMNKTETNMKTFTKLNKVFFNL